MAEVLVVGKKISEMGLVTDIVGDEKIPTGVVGDKAVTTGQLLTYLENNGKVQWGRIEGDITNQDDLQNQFTQERDTLMSYTQDQVSQQQVALQEHIDSTNEAFEYARENGSALPYKEGTTYEENAVVVKDGVLQQWKGGEWEPVVAASLSDTIQTFNTPEAGVDPVTGVANGAYFNVRSSSDDGFLIEYQNIGGVPTPSGKSCPSSAALNLIKEAIIDPETGDAVASKLKDESGKNQQEINNQIKTPLSVNADSTGSIDTTSQLAALLDPTGKHVIQLTKGVYLTDGITIPPNTIVYANGAIFKRKSHSGRPVVIVGENSVLVFARVDGNKDTLGLGALPNRGIDLRRNSYIIFCESYNNTRHGVYAMSEDLMVFDPPSENQKALFCKSYNNGFNPGGGGTADGFSTMNSNNVLFFGCEAWGNARTGFVATTYDRNTQTTDSSYTNRPQTHHCKAWDNGYSDFNFEHVTAPEVSNIEGEAVTFSGSPRANIYNISKIKGIYAQNADYASVSNINIYNDVRSHSLVYIQGKSPQVHNITAIVADSVVDLTTNTIEIVDPETNGGEVSNISVNKAYNGIVLRVANASNLRVDNAQNVWYRITRAEGTVQFTNFKSLVAKKLEVYSSAIPVSGAWNKNDIVWNTFFTATNKTLCWICTTSGVFGTDTPPIFESVALMSRGVSVAKATGTDDTSVKLNALIDSLRGGGVVSG